MKPKLKEMDLEEFEGDEFFVNGQDISRESFNSLMRIKNSSWIDDEWEDDPDDVVRQFYRFMLTDIEKEGSKFDDKAFCFHQMIRDVRAYRRFLKVSVQCQD